MKIVSRRKRSRNPRENLRVSIPADYGWRTLHKLVEDLEHLLEPNDLIRVRRIIRKRDYQEYLALGEDWGPQSITSSDIMPVVISARYQVVALLKKYRFASGDAMRRETALKKFREADFTCWKYNLRDYQQLGKVEDEKMLDALKHTRAFLQELLGFSPPNTAGMTLWSRHGPGANLDTKSGRTSKYFKYSDWPYSCTRRAIPLARAAISDDPRWLGALEDSYRHREGIPMHAILNQDRFWSTVFKVVPGNRIAFVPKSALTDRSIAIEPSMNLWLQLGVDGYIRKRLLRWGVDIDDQSKNQRMAQVGSQEWESPENFVTLDLAAASDSISVEICQQLLPTLWFDHLMKLRSPVGVLNNETIRYGKISSMGNGFTFALETALFAGIVYGVQKSFEGRYDRDKCAIYGDDIIVTNTIAKPVIAMLQLCGFTINSEKSFLFGPFRESCGADFYNGTSVRPVFLTTPPTYVMGLWTDINRLRRILSLRFQVEESKTESWLVRFIPDKYRNVTGPCSDEDFDSYLHVNEPANAVYKYWMWKWRRLVISPKPAKGESFLFRKLMHDLRDQALAPRLFTRSRKTGLVVSRKQTTVGGVFTITRDFSVTVSHTHSVADIWRSEYNEEATLA